MKKNLTQLVGAAVILLISLGAYGMWYANVSAQSAKAAQLTAEIKEKSEATTRVAAAKAELAQLAPQEAEVNQYFISTSNVVPFLEQLAQTGKFLGADVEVTSVSATPGTPYGTLNLSLKITGSFNSVMRTLGSIEYGPYNIRTSAVTLDNGGGQGSDTSAASWTAAGTFVISTQAPAAQPLVKSVASTPQPEGESLQTTTTPVTTPTPTAGTTSAQAAPARSTASTSPASGSASPTI